MQPYRGIDLLGIEARLTDEERQARDVVRAVYAAHGQDA